MQTKTNEQLFYAEQNKIMRNIIHQFELKGGEKGQSHDVHILVLGPRKSGKSSFINTIKLAFGSIKQQPKESPSKITLKKTEIKKSRKYTIEGSKVKEFQNYSGITMFEYNQKIELKTLSKFSRLFDVIDQSNSIFCGQSLTKVPVSIMVKSVVFCFKLGEKLSEDDIHCFFLLINDAKEKNLTPLLILTHLDTYLKRENELQKLQKQIVRISALFEIPRDNIVAIESFTTKLTQQINYYALAVLNNCLRCAKQFTKAKQISHNKSTSMFFCGC